MAITTISPGSSLDRLTMWTFGALAYPLGVVGSPVPSRISKLCAVLNASRCLWGFLRRKALAQFNPKTTTPDLINNLCQKPSWIDSVNRWSKYKLNPSVFCCLGQHQLFESRTPCLVDEGHHHLSQQKRQVIELAAPPSSPHNGSSYWLRRVFEDGTVEQ